MGQTGEFAASSWLVRQVASSLTNSITVGIDHVDTLRFVEQITPESQCRKIVNNPGKSHRHYE